MNSSNTIYCAYTKQYTALFFLLQDTVLWYTTSYIMNRHRSRKKEIIRRISIYSLMSVTAVTLVAVLISLILGYRFNFFTKQVEQTGLVQFNSSPRGARVLIDGQAYEKTGTKNMVLPGEHDFNLQLDGYVEWWKTLSIKAGTVTWLDYPLLVPIEKNIDTEAHLAGLQQFEVSPDRRFGAGIFNDQEGTPFLTLVDFRNSQRPKVLEYPIDMSRLAGDFGESTVSGHDLTIARWADAGRYIILEHSYKASSGSSDAVEWLWFDREDPNTLINITTLVSLPIHDIRYAGGKDIYILQDTGDVRRVGLGNGSISKPLLSGVVRFDSYGIDTLTYISKSSDEAIAGIWRKGWDSPVPVLTAPAVQADSLQVRVSRYFNTDTLVVSDGKTMNIYRGSLSSVDSSRNLLLKSPKQIKTSHFVENLRISPSGRFIVGENDARFTSYDLELKKHHRNLKKYQKDNMQWLNSHYLWQIDSEGMLSIEEFDGANNNRLMVADEKYDVVLTTDLKYIYSLVANNHGGVDLMRLQMTVSS